MAVVFLERKGSKETAFSSCPVVEVCVLSKTLKKSRLAPCFSVCVVTTSSLWGREPGLGTSESQRDFRAPRGAPGLQHNSPVLHQGDVLGLFACCLPGSPLAVALAGDAVLIPPLVLALPAFGARTSWPCCASLGGEGWCHHHFNKSSYKVNLNTDEREVCFLSV